MLDFKPFDIFAPAKLNLYLHITGKRHDGYHTLDSLIAFSDIGDVLRIEPSSNFEMVLQGPFYTYFQDKDKDYSPESTNLIARAAWGLARLVKKSPDVKVTLTKNLPMGAGIGGGSANAAAIIWGMSEIWGLDADTPDFDELLLSLGADVPVCLNCHSARVSGIGETLTPLHLPEVPVVIIYPGKPCKTARIFSLYNEAFRSSPDTVQSCSTLDELIHMLRPLNNDLYKAACKEVPEIDNALNALNANGSCRLSRMSGSGSSCFGIYETIEDAQKIAKEIQSDNPDWWVKAGWIGRPERY